MKARTGGRTTRPAPQWKGLMIKMETVVVIVVVVKGVCIVRLADRMDLYKKKNKKKKQVGV